VTAIFDLASAYSTKQDQLRAEFASASVVSHPDDRGDISEEAWRHVLEALLPRRYRVSKATVVDSRGGRSDAIDVVVHDKHFSPLVFEQNSVLYVPAESVYAVFECKQTLDKDYLDYAADKAASVRRLYRTSAPIVHAGGRIDTPKTPPPILAGVLTTRSEWNPPLGDPFRTHLPRTDDGRVDLGCVVDAGAWEIPRDDGCDLRVSAADKSLVFFVLRLLARLQAMGTVPAMDYDEWSSCLWSE
jgi:hypothetical protein